ncbi:hypothetical protein [Streptomyces sp. NPDC047009]|uniref:hypothetical protein n=1 Tax=Streptomyces sp. NPDC047009 TaxID=3154496 RepID=UPI00340FAB91
MADTLAVLAGRIAALERLVRDLSRASRLANSSIENGSITVYDNDGVLRGSIGLQTDGTVALAAVNGPTPPVPTAPAIASVLGGVAVTWGGQFADGSLAPADFGYVEVHFSTSPDFPDDVSLFAAFYSTQPATMTVPAGVPVWVRLVCVSTSGKASAPSAVAGPAGPAPVVAQSVLDGIVTELALADGAVTQAKIEAGAVGSVALADGAVLEEHLHDAAVSTGKLADSAVNSGKLAADAVTSREIAAGAVTAAEIAAGAITTDKLTVVGGSNLLSDPSFEGPYTAAVVAAAGASWSVDTKGNGSPKSLKVNAVSGTVTTRGVAITTIPILAGEKLFLAYDYQASTDYNGIVKFYAQWLDSSGATLNWGVVQASPSVLGATWQSLSGTVTAPANTVKALIVTESFQASAGTVWWDNCVVRPVLPGTAIADGAITTQKLVAGQINGDRLAAGTVAADRIAAASITAAQIQGLSITADRIAANTITADKLFAGTITAASGVISSIDASKITTGTLDASKASITNLDASAIKAGTISVDRLTAGLAGQVGQKWYDFGESASKWLNSASGTLTTASVTDAQSGGHVMRCVGFIQGAYRPDVKIPFDPSVTYRVSIRVRQTVANSTPGTNQTLYAGVAGLAADGVTFVNLTGANALSSQFYVAADTEALTAGAGWKTFTGYIKGTSASPVRAEAPNANAPAQLYANVRYITPILYANYTGGTGTVELDMFAVEVVETGGISASNIKAGAIDGQTITGATLQTASSGNRVRVINGTYNGHPVGEIDFFNEVGADQPGKFIAVGPVDGGSRGLMGIAPGDATAPWWKLSYETEGVPVKSRFDVSADTTYLGGLRAFGNASIGGFFTAGNIAWGTVLITPTAANTPTSVMVQGLNVAGGTFQVFVSANSGVPGVGMLGVSSTNRSSTGLTLWLTRSDTTTTTVYWMLIGS